MTDKTEKETKETGVIEKSPPKYVRVRLAWNRTVAHHRVVKDSDGNIKFAPQDDFPFSLAEQRITQKQWSSFLSVEDDPQFQTVYDELNARKGD